MPHLHEMTYAHLAAERASLEAAYKEAEGKGRIWAARELLAALLEVKSAIAQKAAKEGARP